MELAVLKEMKTLTTLHRGYQLESHQLPEGWTVKILSHAGHVADVWLHRQLGVNGWSSRDAAEQAGKKYVNAKLDQSSSY